MKHYDILRDAHRAGLITWESIIAKQQQNYPRCPHGTPTAFLVEGFGPLCPVCEAEQHEAIQARIRAKLGEL